ncbi:P44/Msp2 family outer membrane protein [bacterium]|jgi:hypothetical protein|nr:P44/Msp2 family outer membrane protein [bacterium]
MKYIMFLTVGTFVLCSSIFGLSMDVNFLGGTGESSYKNYSNPNTYSEDIYTSVNQGGLNMNLVTDGGIGIGLGAFYLEAPSQLTTDSPQYEGSNKNVEDLEMVSAEVVLKYYWSYTAPISPYVGAGLSAHYILSDGYDSLSFGNNFKAGLSFRVTDDFGLFFEAGFTNFFSKPHDDLQDSLSDSSAAHINTYSFGLKFNS